MSLIKHRSLEVLLKNLLRIALDDRRLLANEDSWFREADLHLWKDRIFSHSITKSWVNTKRTHQEVEVMYVCKRNSSDKGVWVLSVTLSRSLPAQKDSHTPDINQDLGSGCEWDITYIKFCPNPATPQTIVPLEPKGKGHPVQHHGTVIKKM